MIVVRSNESSNTFQTMKTTMWVRVVRSPGTAHPICKNQQGEPCSLALVVAMAINTSCSSTNNCVLLKCDVGKDRDGLCLTKVCSQQTTPTLISLFDTEISTDRTIHTSTTTLLDVSCFDFVNDTIAKKHCDKPHEAFGEMFEYLVDDRKIAPFSKVKPVITKVMRTNIDVFVKAMQHTTHTLLFAPDKSSSPHLKLKLIQQHFFVVAGSSTHTPLCVQNINAVAVVMFGDGVTLVSTSRNKHHKALNGSPPQSTNTVLCDGCPCIMHLREPHSISLRNNDTDEHKQVVGLWLAFEELEDETDVPGRFTRQTPTFQVNTQTETLPLSLSDDEDGSSTQMTTQVSQSLLVSDSKKRRTE